MALKDEAHAASTMQLVPCKSSRLAIRPATTLARSPGKEFSCHGTYPSRYPSDHVLAGLRIDAGLSQSLSPNRVAEAGS